MVVGASIVVVVMVVEATAAAAPNILLTAVAAAVPSTAVYILCIGVEFENTGGLLKYCKYAAYGGSIFCGVLAFSAPVSAVCTDFGGIGAFPSISCGTEEDPPHPLGCPEEDPSSTPGTPEEDPPMAVAPVRSGPRYG